MLTAEEWKSHAVSYKFGPVTINRYDNGKWSIFTLADLSKNFPIAEYVTREAAYEAAVARGWMTN